MVPILFHRLTIFVLIPVMVGITYSQFSITANNLLIQDNKVFNGSEADNTKRKDDSLSIFNHFFNNLGNSFKGKYIMFHLSGVAATYLMVKTEVDYQVHHYFNKQENNDRYGPWFFPSVITGMFIPFLAGGGLYFRAKSTKNEELKYASCAVFQASLITFIYISTLKAITGRPPGPEDDEIEDAKQLSKEFNFGFFRKGIFYGWPSGHTGATMAVVSALTNFYPDKNWLKIFGYTFVAYTGVGMSVNFRGRLHWFSDAVAAAFMVYTIGSTVGKYYRQRYTEKYSCTSYSKLTIIPYSDNEQLRLYLTYQF
jgi:membrane-associated phospholipid phosphatase